MRPWTAAALFAGGLLAGCMAGGPATTAQPSSPSAPAAAARPANPGGSDVLLLDRADLRIGVTVQYRRVPGIDEVAELRQVPGLAHLVLTLPAWPATYEALQSLNQLPPEADVIVVLPDYPPSREAAEAWNLVQARLRLVLVVPSPPPSAGVVADLNAMRGLERVIADVDPPTRAGFERLQRPLSFRKLMD